MPTVPELEGAFRVHLDEMVRCIEAKAYWALLHLVVVVPDICGALENEDGRASRDRYISWCRAMFPPSPPAPLTPEDRYEIRCIVLHQGSSRATRGQYSFYKFVKPENGITLHQIVWSDGQIVLDVIKMAEETTTAVKDWFQDLQDPANATKAANVTGNLPTLVQARPQALPGIGGIIRHITSTSTESS
jgi:hypothetical protein